MTIRVVLADDQALLRGTFRMLIDSCDDLTVVGEACDGSEAIALARQCRPDVIVMDVRMPGVDGLTATETICADPDLDMVEVLILTTFENDEYLARALRGGASGFLGKHATTDALLDAIRVVARGDRLLSPTAIHSLITRFLAEPASEAASVATTGAASLAQPPALAALTAREREVMTLAAQGLSNDEIAGLLHLSVLTVRTHVHRAMTKLGARDRAQLVVFAYRSGLVRGLPGD